MASLVTRSIEERTLFRTVSEATHPAPGPSRMKVMGWNRDYADEELPPFSFPMLRQYRSFSL